MKMRKKLITGLLALTLSLSGCIGQMTINEKVQRIKKNNIEIRKILDIQPGESYFIINNEKGVPYKARVRGNNKDRSITFYDSDGDGIYDGKIELELNMFPAPKYQNNIEENKEEKADPKLMVYRK